jgi:hypothetical protein
LGVPARDLEDVAVERPNGLGYALRRAGRTSGTADEDFIVLADPEGNLFCVIQDGD